MYTTALLLATVLQSGRGVGPDHDRGRRKRPTATVLGYSTSTPFVPGPPMANAPYRALSLLYICGDCTALNTHASRNSLRRSSEQAQATGNTLSYFLKKKRNCCSVLVLSCSHCLRHTSCGSASAATCEGTSAHHGIFLTLQSDSGDLTPKGQDSCGDLFKRKR